MPVLIRLNSSFDSSNNGVYWMQYFILFPIDNSSPAQCGWFCIVLTFQEYPGYVAYTTPTFFADDWLNMYLDSHPIHRDSDIANHTNEINCADYRFVYMGPKGKLCFKILLMCCSELYMYDIEVFFLPWLWTWSHIRCYTSIYYLSCIVISSST